LLLRSRLEAAAADPTDPESLRLPANRRDELGSVMSAFNAMSRSIANHVAASREAREALAQAKADLEARVAERTHELVAANESLQREISERRRAEAQLKHDAFHDRLTQLPNRELFVDRIQHWISRAGRANETGFAVILVNIDRFSVVNDSLGHQAGDQLLALVAERLRRALRPGDTLARLAGDDFALLVEAAGTSERAASCAHRLREQLVEPFMIDAEAVYCTCSMGITTSSFGYIRAGAMIQDAQLALHQAKRAGKDRFEQFQASMRASPTRILKVEADLRRALERGDELVLHYQPIISVRTGKVAGFEALMRWQHPERGLIPPAEFIPLAEDTGLIVPMGRWVLAEAVRQVDAWAQKFPDHRDLFASVNVSSRQLIDPHLVDDVRSALGTVSLQPSNLKLEVTESLLIRNPELALSILRELKHIGAKLCIDDFGTGYSSLSYLRRFPFDVLKIDRSFVREMAEGRQSFEIVRTITDLARILNMHVVAEGAETEDVVERLNALGCDFVQGFFFAPPVEAHHAEKFLVEERRPWRLKYRPQPVSLMGERMAG
jgi:diguanylate cyclase (GGDEF)-like protein